MNQFCGRLLLLALLSPPTLCAQNASRTTQSATGAIVATPESKPEKKNAKKSDVKNFHVEVGGFYSPFVPGPGANNWRGWDTRLTYTGFKRFAPFGGVARISNSKGSQYSLGVGSYVVFTKWFYAIAGMSGSPSAPFEFSPHRRYDVAGIFSVPKVKGMAFSTGLTVLPAYKNGGGGQILALGDIYYWRKFIFSGSVNLNFAQPGNRRSVSGQFAATYGTQGKYYLAGGMSGGGAAYMLITGVPFEVRYQSVGGFVSLSKWLSKHIGINSRYDYQKIVGSDAQRHAFRTALFYEF